MSGAPQPRMHGLTHVVGGPDPIPGFGTPPLPTLGEAILALTDLVAFWKLNETSGTTAADSLNGWDLEPQTFPGNPYSPPTWANNTTPYDEPSALFDDGQGESNASFPSLTGDFTMGIWARKNPQDHGGYIITQGDPTAANASGFGLRFGLGPDTIALYIGDTTGGPHSGGFLSTPSNATWYFIVATHEGNISTLYVDAVATGTPYDDGGTNYSPASGGISIGNVTGAATVDAFEGNLSYGFILSRALSAAEIASLYLLGSEPSASADGWVWTNDDGTPSWQPPTIAVDNGTVGRYEQLTIGTGLAGTDNADGSITIAFAADMATQAELDAHLNDTTDAHDASAISNVAAGGISATNVQAALEELSGEIAGLGDPADDTAVWMPLTTVSGGVPELVWEADDGLIPTLVPLA